eukprot:scaffold42326_cov38-Cyclotella_meneghiniana.AAC.3
MGTRKSRFQGLWGRFPAPPLPPAPCPQQHLEDMSSHREHLEFFDGSYLISRRQSANLGRTTTRTCLCHTPGQHILRSYR